MKKVVKTRPRYLEYEGNNRYQHVNVFKKLYRRITVQWKIPFTVFYWFLVRPYWQDQDGTKEYWTLRLCRDIAISESHYKMGWYYNWSELKEDDEAAMYNETDALTKKVFTYTMLACAVFITACVLLGF